VRDELGQEQRVEVVARGDAEGRFGGAGVEAALPGVRAEETDRPPSAAPSPGPAGASPVSVGVIALPARTSSASPVRRASRRSWALTCGWLLPRRMAARETLRSLIKVCNTRTR
jgi:hypothetical protein